MIPVTKPFMPPKEEYVKYLEGIWQREYLTNNGPLVQELEMKLKDYLGVEYMSYLTNGTIALQIAMKALDLKGEIITTPFSFVATTSSIIWEGCTPVFVDIDANSLNINPELIEPAITEHTSAIVATHVFGNPCDIDAIQELADRYSLKVIYDASHCFGTKYKGKSVFNYGDISTASFHATKLFQTVEGGAIFTQNKKLFERTNYMRNFGHDGPSNFNGVGINGKNSELHAAMGLCNFKYIHLIQERRSRQCEIYDSLLEDKAIVKQQIQSGTTFCNRAYYPVILESENQALRVKKNLENADIFPRRYFYPSLNRLSYTENASVPCSEDISRRILCLPLYHNLREYEQYLIAEIMSEGQRIAV